MKKFKKWTKKSEERFKGAKKNNDKKNKMK